MEIYKNLSLEDLPNEEWRDVVDWEHSHQISNLGRVKTKERIRKWGRYTRKQKAKIVAQYKKKNGYLSLHLHDNNRFKNVYTHRLVVESFERPMVKGEEVNHIDKNKINNIVSNLEICSRRYNMLYSKEEIIESTSKKVYRYTIDGLYDKEYKSVVDAAKDNNVGASNIVYACKGGRNMSNNYRFRYEKCDNIIIPDKKYKDVIAIDSDGKLLEFKSPKEAAEYFGVKYNTIISACIKNIKCKGYTVKYK